MLPPAAPAPAPTTTTTTMTTTTTARVGARQFKAKKKRYVTAGASLNRIEAMGLIAKKPRQGWAPHQSLVRERSLEFNLTLDLQHLRQEIDGLVLSRELLRSRALVQRAGPEGPLAQTMRAYYSVFRQGFIPPETNADMAFQQQAFVQSVLHEHVDFGNGLTGVDVMIRQGRAYAQLMRIISLQMDQLHIAEAGDSVVVHSKGRFRFQIQPQTIAGLFPHVADNERIRSRLIGQAVDVATSITFSFDSSNRIIKCGAVMDLVSAFMELLQEPRDVAELLGQALIGDNCMIELGDGGECINELPNEPNESFLLDGMANNSVDAIRTRAGRANAGRSVVNKWHKLLNPAEMLATSDAPMSLAFILG